MVGLLDFRFFTIQVIELGKDLISQATADLQNMADPEDKMAAISYNTVSFSTQNCCISPASVRL